MTESAPLPGDQARALLRCADRATLATALSRDLGLPRNAGWPYASLTLLATDVAGQPLLLLSTLADHTQNILADDRVSLLIDGTAGLAEPLTGPRLSLIGTAVRADDAAARRRYLARHPSAAGYADFKDFAFYRVILHSAHLVAGFGRISWIAAADLLGPPPAPALIAAEADIVAHMNADHAEAIGLYASVLLGLPGGAWQMTGLDAQGCDLRLGGHVARLPFAAPVHDAEQARAELVRLVKLARAR